MPNRIPDITAARRMTRICIASIMGIMGLTPAHIGGSLRGAGMTTKGMVITVSFKTTTYLSS